MLQWLIIKAVFGAPLMADLGKLIVVLAGPSAAVDRILPYCEGV
jgi:hypothetical protein